MKMANDSDKVQLPPAPPSLLPLYILFFSRDAATTFAAQLVAFDRRNNRATEEAGGSEGTASVPCVENVRKGVSDLTTPQHEGENNGVTGEREERRRDEETHAETVLSQREPTAAQSD